MNAKTILFLLLLLIAPLTIAIANAEEAAMEADAALAQLADVNGTGP